MKSKYKAMVLSCIDPRFQPIVFNFLQKKNLKGKYSFFSMAGSSLGVTANKFKNWRKIMDTNLDGTFLTTQNVIKYLKKTKGNIINIASISGLRASTLRIAYGTSKAAIIQLTQQQAIELGEFGIRVNCVSPGPVKTKLAKAVHTPDIVKAYHDSIPLNRYGMENEIAEAIFFLSSEKASYITGQNLSVDGGFEASGVGLISLRES